MKNILLLAILLSFSLCSPKKQTVFYAFTDGFMDWYKLELYHDNSFDLHIPSNDFTGVYKLNADTIVLVHEEHTNTDVPQAYLINTQKQKIDELILSEGCYIIKKKNNRWIHIVTNDLRNSTKKPQ